MLKGYRKRFVIANMSLIGTVLIVVFVAIGIFMYKSDYSELQNTLSHVVAPWNEPTDSFRRLDDIRPPEGRPDGDKPDRDIPPTGKPENKPDGGNKSIITVFVDGDAEELSLLSEDESLDTERIQSAVYKIISLDEPFGTLKEYDFIYYKEQLDGSCKIALADTSYMASRVAENVLLLLLAFAVSMGLFFCISLWLSKLAARPMERAIDMERQFVADISHDLKTPITVVLANNSILKSSPDSRVSDQTQWIESTDSAAKNMMTLVNEMLTLSSLESAERAVKKEPVNLSSAAEKAVLQMESIAYDRGITVESAIAEGVTATADPEHISRIFSGLLDNALKYEPDGGRVEVKLEKTRKKAVFSVQNHGSFIEPDDIPHIFERFYRGDKARDTQKGHGLGLPIIKQMAELSNADIEAKSDKSHGTEFAVTFDIEDK